jgi:hypothetical protein
VLAYLRRARDGTPALVVANLTPVVRGRTTASGCPRAGAGVRPSTPTRRLRRLGGRQPRRRGRPPPPLPRTGHSVTLPPLPPGDWPGRGAGACRMTRYVCVHGHFYQPPREHPWLEEVEQQDAAYPFHDWNERITAECYAPERPRADPRRRGPHHPAGEHLRVPVLQRRVRRCCRGWPTPTRTYAGSSRPTAAARPASAATGRRWRRPTATRSCRWHPSGTGARRSAGASPTSAPLRPRPGGHVAPGGRRRRPTLETAGRARHPFTVLSPSQAARVRDARVTTSGPTWAGRRRHHAALPGVPAVGPHHRRVLLRRGDRPGRGLRAPARLQRGASNSGCRGFTDRRAHSSCTSPRTASPTVTTTGTARWRWRRRSSGSRLASDVRADQLRPVPRAAPPDPRGRGRRGQLLELRPRVERWRSPTAAAAAATTTRAAALACSPARRARRVRERLDEMFEDRTRSAAAPTLGRARRLPRGGARPPRQPRRLPRDPRRPRARRRARPSTCSAAGAPAPRPADVHQLRLVLRGAVAHRAGAGAALRRARDPARPVADRQRRSRGGA